MKPDFESNSVSNCPAYSEKLVLTLLISEHTWIVPPRKNYGNWESDHLDSACDLAHGTIQSIWPHSVRASNVLQEVFLTLSVWCVLLAVPQSVMGSPPPRAASLWGSESKAKRKTKTHRNVKRCSAISWTRFFFMNWGLHWHVLSM